MIDKPANWARCDVSRFHSKSSAYADGYSKGWAAALAAAANALDAALAATTQPSEPDSGS